MRQSKTVSTLDRKIKKTGGLQWALIVLSCFLSKIIVNNRAEIYIFLTCAFAILGSHIIAQKGRIKIRLTSYHLYILLFCVFCYVSSMWAINPSQSIGKGNTLLEIFILMSVIFLCVDVDANPIDKLLKSVMWAGFLAVIYIILNYGLSNIIHLVQNSARFDNSLLNANTIGITGAYSLLIAEYYIMYDGFSLWNVMAIPTIIVVLGSVSRKAFLILIIGTFLLFAFKYHYRKNIIDNFIKMVIIILGGLLLLFLISRLPFMEYTVNRLNRMILAFAGRADGNETTLTRLRLIDLGINLFKEHPIVGVGMDNATMYVARLFNKDYYYLHNNYVELLADGGIIGFAIYYAFYIKLFISMLRHRDFGNREYNISFVLFILLLIMDYGKVSYWDKETYFLLMIIYFMYRKVT